MWCSVWWSSTLRLVVYCMWVLCTPWSHHQTVQYTCEMKHNGTITIFFPNQLWFSYFHMFWTNIILWTHCEVLVRKFSLSLLKDKPKKGTTQCMTFATPKWLNAPYSVCKMPSSKNELVVGPLTLLILHVTWYLLYTDALWTHTAKTALSRSARSRTIWAQSHCLFYW